MSLSHIHMPGAAWKCRRKWYTQPPVSRHLPPKEQQESCCQGTKPLQKVPVLCNQGQTRQQQSAHHREEAGPNAEHQAVWRVAQLQA